MAQFRQRIYDSVLETIGATPLVRVPRLAAEHGCVADLVLKLEFFNPLASVKDRIGLAMVEDAQAKGTLRQDSVLIEPTSGNTGIALAFVAAAKQLRLILVMPESMSLERRKMLRLLGAELVLTPAAEGMRGAVARAEALVASTPKAVMLQQFNNPANPAIHARTTAEEIWHDCGGHLDVIISGVGTGGTLTGLAAALRPRLPQLKFIAVEPADSAVLSGKPAGAHKIQGIGAGFVPQVLATKEIDEIITVTNADAIDTARLAAKQEGLPIGISSGAALWAGLQVAARPALAGKRLVVIIPSFAERYLSTALFEGFDA